MSKVRKSMPGESSSEVTLEEWPIGIEHGELSVSTLLRHSSVFAVNCELELQSFSFD